MVLRYRVSRLEELPERGADAASEIVGRIRVILDLDPVDVVSVMSHSCGDPNCGDAMATILLMRAGRPTASVKLWKSLSALTEDDLRQALAPFLSTERSAGGTPVARASD